MSETVTDAESAAAPRGRRLDPDALAALEDERRFLLRSIADLDAEHAAGDIDDDDYTTLRDDYTRRAAEVIRAVDERRRAFEATPRVRGRQVLVWVVGLALLGGLSGVLIARSSGARSDGDQITGGVRPSTVSQLNQARSLLGDQEQWDEAIAVYDDVLRDDPSNPEALTYRAWLEYRDGASPDDALETWADVRRVDPDYGDAVVFTAIVLSDLGRWDEAEEVLESIDPATAPAEVTALIAQRGLAGEIYGESRFDAIVDADEPTLEALDLTIDQALAAAGHLVGSDRAGGPVAALELYRAVLAEDPDHPAALSRQALVLASAGEIERALELLDRAVAAHPDDAEALVTRATVTASTDPDVACDDLAVVATLADVAPELVAQAEQVTVVAGCA